MEMKCTNCGGEIQIGEGFCHFCGKEIRIVPDYNVLEDDLHVLIEESNKNGKNSGTAGSKQITSPEKITENREEKENLITKNTKTPEKNYKKIIIILCSIVAFIFLIIIIYAFISTSKKEKSFIFQYDKALEYMDEGLYLKARKCIDQALEISPDDQKAMLKLAELDMLEDKNGKAINQYLDIIALYPTEKAAYEKLLTLYEKDNDKEAILELTNSIKSSNRKILNLFKDYIVAGPEFEVKPGTFDKETKVTLSAATNAQIYYTVDGMTPTINSELYSDGILLEEGTHIIRAIAINDYDISSKIVEGKFEIVLTAPEAPKADVDSGTYDTEKMITISMPEGCVVFYTWDGTSPNANSFAYTGPIKMEPGNNVLSLIAIDGNKKSSEIVRYNYIYQVVGN